MTGLSIVIVNWNTRELVLRLCAELRRVAESLPRSLEVIVVDNASSDGSVAAVRAAHPEVRVLSQPDNRGFGAGVNKGLAAATGRYVLLLNTDVPWGLDGIETLVRYAERHPEAAITGPRVVDPDGTPQPSCWRAPTGFTQMCEALGLSRLFPGSWLWNRARYGGRQLDAPGPVDCVSGSVLLLDPARIVPLGGFDEGYFMYFEETDLCQRVRAAGHQVHYAPVATFAHARGGSGGRVRERLFVEFKRSEIRYHRKHGGALAGVRARLCAALALGLRAVGLGLCGSALGDRRRLARAWLCARTLPRVLGPLAGPGAAVRDAATPAVVGVAASDPRMVEVVR
jgi:hypothetical protein